MVNYYLMEGNKKYTTKDKKIREKQISKVKDVRFNKIYELFPTTKLDEIPISKIVQKVSKVIKTLNQKLFFKFLR